MKKKSLLLICALFTLIYLNAQCVGPSVNITKNAGVCTAYFWNVPSGNTVSVTANGAAAGAGTSTGANPLIIVLSSCATPIAATMVEPPPAPFVPCAFSVPPVVVLPIKITSFTGNLNGNNAQLVWSAESDVASVNYMVEKSIDGVNFSTIYTVTGATNFSKSNNYSFSDISSISNNNFYRLKFVTPDGKFGYSSIVKLSNRTKFVEINPNPVIDHLNLNVSNNFIGGNYKIYSTTGSVLKQETISNMSQSVNISLPKGQYFLRAESNTKDGITKTIFVQ